MAENLTIRPTSDADDDVRAWQYKINRGIKYRDEAADRWSVNEAFDDMKQWSDDGETFRSGQYDEPTINKISSFIKTYRAAVCYKNPKAKMTPKTAAAWEPIQVPVMGPDGQPLANEQGQIKVRTFPRYQMRERLLNEIASSPMMNLADTITRVVKSGCLAYGAIMVGYAPTFGTSPEKDTDTDEIPISPEGVMDLSEFQTNPVSGMPILDHNDKPIKRKTIPVWEEWFIDWVHYRKVVIDPDGGNDFMKHRWVAVEETRTLEEVQDDPMFKNTDELESTGTLLSENKDYHRRIDLDGMASLSDRSDLKTVRLFFIFDLVKDRMIVIADGHGKALYDEPMPLGITHSPLVFFRPNEIIAEEEGFFPRAPVTELVPLVAEKNELRRMALLGAKRGVRKVMVAKGSLEDGEADKFMSDVDMEVVYYKQDIRSSPDKVAGVLSMPPISSDVWNTMRACDADFDEIAGQGAESRGRTTGDTATAVGKRSQYEVARYDFDRQQLARFLREVYKKLDDSIEANMTIPRAIQLVGDDGQAFMGLVDRDMIACDVDIDIDVQEMAPTDSEGEAARMIQFQQVIGQSPWMASDEAVLRTMCERLRIKDENFITGMAKLAQQQMQMMQQQAMAKAQPKVPNAPPPESEAQAISQTAGGTQVPNMQGAA